MVAFGRKKNLRFEFQSAKSFAVNDPVPVPLEIRPQVAGLFRSVAPGAFSGAGCIRRQQEELL
jgi:hypothetical protein